MWVELVDKRISEEYSVYNKSLGGEREEKLEIGTEDRRTIYYFKLTMSNPEEVIHVSMK